MKKISNERLKTWKSEKNTKKLISALKNGVWNVRAIASGYLCEINDSSAKYSLINSLSDSNPKVVENVNLALQRLDLSAEEINKIKVILELKDKEEKEKLTKELVLYSINYDKEKAKQKKIEETKQNRNRLKQKETKLIVINNKEEKDWFYRKKKEQIGPLKLHEIQNLIKNGQIKLSDYVWATGLKEWIKVNSIEGFDKDIDIEEIPPSFVKQDNKFVESIKELKSKIKQSTKSNFERIKDEIKKPIIKRVATIGLPVVSISLVILFIFFAEINFETGTTSTCYSCLGSGINGDECTVCEGDGKITISSTCNACKGRRTQRCNYSFTTYYSSNWLNQLNNSAGKVAAEYKCKGGRYSSSGGYYDDYYDEICSSCNGTGRVDCNNCNGYGKVNKSTDCSHCNNGKTNIKDCNTCDKTGIVPNYTEYTIYEKYILPLFSRKQSIPQKISKEPNVPGKFPQASTRLLNSSDLKNLSKSDLRIMRNEIFARHGHIFNSGDLGKYFKKQTWYRGTVKNAGSLLSNIENKNVQLILKYE